MVVSSDHFNQSRIRTVLAIAITSNLRLAEAPGNIELTTEESGLNRDSVVNVSQMATLDKSALSDRAGGLGPATMRRVEAGMALALGLPTAE